MEFVVKEVDCNLLESINFIYDGISCKDMGVTMVQGTGGQYEESLFANRKVITQTIPHREKSIFKRVEYEPLSFSIPVYLDGWQDRNNLRAIARWLFKDEFKPLIFESNSDNIYYAMVDGDVNLLHNGVQQGLLTIPFICNSPYSYSELKVDVMTVQNSVTRSYFNEGDLVINPQIKIRKIGDGDIRIKNLANNQEMIITGLYNNEVVTVNGENQEIVSSLEQSNNRYLLTNHNDVWLDFEPNYFSPTEFLFTGSFQCEFYYENKYLNQDLPIYFT